MLKIEIKRERGQHPLSLSVFNAYRRNLSISLLQARVNVTLPGRTSPGPDPENPICYRTPLFRSPSNTYSPYQT